MNQNAEALRAVLEKLHQLAPQKKRVHASVASRFETLPNATAHVAAGAATGATIGAATGAGAGGVGAGPGAVVGGLVGGGLGLAASYGEGKLAKSMTLKDLINFNPGEFGTGDQAHFAALSHGTKDDFIQMLIAANLGRPVQFTSGQRSEEEQARLKTKYPKAQVGHSLHQSGEALDLDARDVAALAAIPGLLKEFNFSQIVGDPVHLQHYSKKYAGGTPQAPEDGIAGEAGPEFVSSGTNVTSAADTKAIFIAMSEKLDKLISVADKGNGLAQKQLLAMS
jgi:hypothetical protein